MQWSIQRGPTVRLELCLSRVAWPDDMAKIDVTVLVGAEEVANERADLLTDDRIEDDHNLTIEHGGDRDVIDPRIGNLWDSVRSHGECKQRPSE